MPASPALNASSVITPPRTSVLYAPTLHVNPQQMAKPHPQPKSAPDHRRRHVVAWVPDSLAEKCYSCQTSFSLMLRRHHCRRCGNVFCDACSSARMPLVHSGFVTPVRVCAKCSVAAKKAHAQMVQARQKARYDEPPRRHSDIVDREGLTQGERMSYSTIGEKKSRHMPEKRRRGSDRPLGARAPLDYDCTMMEGGIITSNGRRSLATSPVFARKGSSDSYERLESEETEESSGCDERYWQTLPGEAILVKNDHVRAKVLDQIEDVGSLYVTNYRLVFCPHSDMLLDGKNGLSYGQEEGWSYVHPESFEAYRTIPLTTIDRVKRKEVVETDSGVLEIIGKDFRRIHFIFEGLVSKQTFSKFDRTYALVRMGISDGQVDEFAKFSLERFDQTNEPVDGWRIYDAVEEFQRMGISSSTNRWRLSYVNEEYELCPTYPSILAVPSSVSDSLLAVASKFRSKGRIPVLSWRDQHTGAVICRSSQPLVGLGQNQCDKDVLLIQAIAAANPSSSKLVIIDARPWKNAVAQKAVGRAGYELTEHYETRHATSSLEYVDMVASEHTAAAAASFSAGPTTTPFDGALDTGEVQIENDMNGLRGNYDRQRCSEPKASTLVLTECKLIFMGIENIHTMRKSYHKIMDLCTTKQNPDKWLDQLASTHWLNHISRILDSAVEIVRIVKEQKSSVLIHCSDGWDRTAQLTALTELLIDPFYRTILGFERLIEKEWCSFGHKFRDRTSHDASNSTNETSPVFLQWIDCVWQVMVQFPSAFEFNERYLILILDHLYSCRFGTFLYNSQRERMEQESLHPTHSLWSFLNTVEHTIVVNPFYKPHDKFWRKWKDTRQDFKKPLIQLCKDFSRTRFHKTFNDCGAPSMTDECQRNAFGASDWSSALRNSSMACTSSVALPVSPTHFQIDATEAGVNAALQSTREQLSIDMQRGHVNNHNASLNDNVLKEGEGGDDSTLMKLQPPSYYKLVRDFDFGISYPQPSKCSTSSEPHSRFLYQDRDAINKKDALGPSTPKSRSSLTSQVTAAAPLTLDIPWSIPDGDATFESDGSSCYRPLASCEDVIVPSCTVKSLSFWAHYYLRWDPTCHFDREASVGIELLHLDVLKRLQVLTRQVEIMREARIMRRGKVQTNSRCDRSSVPAQRHTRRKLLKESTSLKGDAGNDSTLEEKIALLKEQRLRRLEEVEASYQEQLVYLLKELPS